MGRGDVEIIRRRIEERQRVIEGAKKWAYTLRFKVTAILIGSYARGDFNEWSDVDVVLITDELRGNPLERLKKVDFPPGYEVVVLATTDFKVLLKKNNPIAVEVINNGVVLRDDYGILQGTL